MLTSYVLAAYLGLVTAASPPKVVPQSETKIENVIEARGLSWVEMHAIAKAIGELRYTESQLEATTIDAIGNTTLVQLSGLGEMRPIFYFTGAVAGTFSADAKEHAATTYNRAQVLVSLGVANNPDEIPSFGYAVLEATLDKKLQRLVIGGLRQEVIGSAFQNYLFSGQLTGIFEDSLDRLCLVNYVVDDKVDLTTYRMTTVYGLDGKLKQSRTAVERVPKDVAFYLHTINKRGDLVVERNFDFHRQKLPPPMQIVETSPVFSNYQGDWSVVQDGSESVTVERKGDIVTIRAKNISGRAFGELFGFLSVQRKIDDQNIVPDDAKIGEVMYWYSDPVK